MNKNLTKLHDDMNVLFRKSGVIVVSAYGSQALMVYSNDAGGVFTATIQITRNP